MGRNKSLLGVSHLHIYLWKSRVVQCLFSVPFDPQARLKLPERQEGTSVNADLVKLACEDKAAVTEFPETQRCKF